MQPWIIRSRGGRVRFRSRARPSRIATAMNLARFRATFAALLVLASFGAAAATIEVPQLRMPDFKRLERELRLRPEQKAQYDVAVASLQRTLLASAGIFMELKQQLADELVRPRPDFRRLFSSQ